MNLGEDCKKALKYCFFLLKYRARSEDEIVSRLKKKGYDEDTIKEAISYLRRQGYINDEKFAETFIADSINKGWGKLKIAFALKKLGVKVDFDRSDFAGNEIYRERLRNLIKIKSVFYGKKSKQIDTCRRRKDIFSKLMSFLLSRGFEYEEINAEIEAMGMDVSECE
jgi:regulatory protein